MSNFPKISEFDEEEQLPLDAGGADGGAETSDLIKNYLLRQNQQMLQRQESAEQAAADNRYAAQLGGAFNTIGQSMAGQKVDNSAFQKMAEAADEPIQRMDRMDKNRLGRDKLVTDYIVSKYKVGEANKQRADAADERSRHNRMMEQIGMMGAGQRQEVSDKQEESITAYDKTLDHAKDLLQTYKPDYTGPINEYKSSKIGKLFSDPEAVTYQSKLGRLVDVYRVLTTGAGAGDKELAKIESRLPQKDDTPEVFKAKLEDYIAEVQKARSRYVSNLAKKGKRVQNFQTAEAPAAPPAGAKAPPTTGKVRVIKKATGKAGWIPESQLKQALESGEYTKG